MLEDVKRAIECQDTRRVKDDQRRLECKLSEAELNIRGEELATAVQKLAEAEKLEAERRKEAKDKLTVIAVVVKDKKEVRGVTVVSDLVSTADGLMVRETRTDTGEVLQLRQPTQREQQPGMAL